MPANHMDDDRTRIRQTNFITNILPQVSQMNRCVWLQTEEIVECYRDIWGVMEVMGQVSHCTFACCVQWET